MRLVVLVAVGIEREIDPVELGDGLGMAMWSGISCRMLEPPRCIEYRLIRPDRFERK
jgi:hypothetical protein